MITTHHIISVTMGTEMTPETLVVYNEMTRLITRKDFINVQTLFILKFRIVFWDVLPCKIIVDRRFRGSVLPPSSLMTIILHGSTSQKTILNFILAAVRTLNLTVHLRFTQPTMYASTRKVLSFTQLSCLLLAYLSSQR
jgi:hypothetical protein